MNHLKSGYSNFCIETRTLTAFTGWAFWEGNNYDKEKVFWLSIGN